MKRLPVFLVLLLVHISQAQTRPRPQAKQPIVKSTNSILPRHDKPVEQLSIGDTCYVITNNLPMRGRPEVTSSAATYLQRNAKVIVQEVLNEQWILIDYYNLDVGVRGYVSRQSVSRKKAD